MPRRGCTTVSRRLVMWTRDGRHRGGTVLAVGAGGGRTDVVNGASGVTGLPSWPGLGGAGAGIPWGGSAGRS